MSREDGILVAAFGTTATALILSQIIILYGSSATAAAWLQAITSALAIAAALGIPAWRRAQSIRDARVNEARQAKIRLKRLTAALTAEVRAARGLIEAQHSQIEAYVGHVQSTLPGRPKILSAIVITDAFVYQRATPELGLFPSELVTAFVKFYSLAMELGRLHARLSSDRDASVLLLFDKIALKKAALLLIKLSKFESADFVDGVDLSLTRDERDRLAKEQKVAVEWFDVDEW